MRRNKGKWRADSWRMIALIRTLDHDSLSVYNRAASVLGEIGALSRGAVPHLLTIHDDIHNTERASLARVSNAIEAEVAACEGIR